ncbi:Leucine-rich PPR motif-containing protein, mitochondrial [Portunus trituberculatus]|uniref:Leucine-rich PPR motif-containing protein, mitochondrial n=1 Tax=Portunus trituberculatus TaxID=210409 RepID=A0A5B7I0X1_PORTR|nr:Leucine-rich PPR motif-containing protein, mitochondrial [Portunus trituberculatus]
MCRSGREARAHTGRGLRYRRGMLCLYRGVAATPGLRAFNGKLDQKCNWLRDMGKIDELANLVSVTKDIFDIDRDMMYSNLLKAYEKKKLEIIKCHEGAEEVNFMTRNLQLPQSIVPTVIKQVASVKKAGETASTLMAKDANEKEEPIVAPVN